MKHIILAAGLGNRLIPMSTILPKVLFDLGQGGDSLLSRQIDTSLAHGGITEIVVVVGYKSELIREAIERKYDKRISIVENAHYRINNPLYSIAAADDRWQDDFVLTNGDIYYHPLTFAALASRGPGITLAISAHRDTSERAMSIQVAGNQLLHVGYGSPGRSALYESPGIVVVKGSSARRVFGHCLAEHLAATAGQNHPWHDIFNYIKEYMPVRVQLIAKDAWAELDDSEDLVDLRDMRLYARE